MPPFVFVDLLRGLAHQAAQDWLGILFVVVLVLLPMGLTLRLQRQKAALDRERERRLAQRLQHTDAR